MDGRTTVKSASIRLYTYAEVVKLLSSAGFTEVRGVDPSTDNPFRLGSRRLFLVAEKQAGVRS